MQQKFLISGLVEKNDQTFFLIDFDKKLAKKYSNIIVKKKSYKDGKSYRYLSLIPIEMNNYEKFKDGMLACIKKLKKSRIKNLKRTTYKLNGKEIGINLRKNAIKYFLKNKDFLDFIIKNTEPNNNVLNYTTERQIKNLMLSSKSILFTNLRKIKKTLYSNDLTWINFLTKNKISIAVVLPTYNEVNFETNVQIVHKLKEIGLFKELIISDGFSTIHKPADIKKKLSERGNNFDFTIIKQNGSGKGEAIEAAVKYSLLHNHDFLILVDSDVLPSLRRAYPDSPLNIDIEFFVRKFIYSIIQVTKKNGLSKSKNVFFKASYLRMPQLKKSLELRYGLATNIVKDFFEKNLHSYKNLYPLSGEVAFNPEFFLQNLNLTNMTLKKMNLQKNQYCGINVPSGFCLENFWNSIIDINHHFVYYVNMYTHHHGPVVKSSKRSIEDQRGEVMTGAIAGILTALNKHNKLRALFKQIPLDIIRSNRTILEVDAKIQNKIMYIGSYRICL